MTDNLTAQKILQDWATSRGFSTTLTVDKDGPGERLYFHFDKLNGFAFLNFQKSPSLTLVVSNSVERSAISAWLLSQPGWGEFERETVRPIYSSYDLNLADSKVFVQIERILERTIDSYLEG